MLLSDVIAGWAGVILSVLLEWFPKWDAWFHELTNSQRRAVTAAAIVLVGVAVGSLSCAGWLDWLSCDANGWRAVLGAIFMALIGSQGAHPLTKRPADV